MTSTMYSPLDASTGEIRLLTIQPHDPSSSELRCTLRKVRLDDSVKYQALSYVWGTEPPTQSILINDEKVDIRPNLHSALFQIQGSFVDLDLWCDALCINQADIQERNREVLRMRDIYSKAERVVIWLGEEGQDSDMAIRNIRDWGDFYPTLIEEPDSLLEPVFEEILWDPVAWEAMSHLFERPWWYRIWILQEVAVAQSAILVCGSEHCEWLSFVCAIAAWGMLKEPGFLQYLTQDQRITILSVRPDVGAAALELQAREASHLRMNLWSLMQFTSGFNATDPRDKIYALLGLDKVADIAITPKYHDPIERVYLDLVRAFVREKRRLSVLGGAGIGNLKPGPPLDLPSWVPDLRGLSPMLDDYMSFDAAGSTDAVATSSADFRLLSTQGIICASIEQLEPQPLEDALARTVWVDLVLSNSQPIHPTGMTQMQAYFRTLIGDSSNGAFCPDDFPDSYDATMFYNQATAFLSILGSMVLERSDIKKKMTRLPQETLDDLDLNDYVRWYAAWEGKLPDPVSEEGILESFLGTRGSRCRLAWPTITEQHQGWNSHRLFVDAMGNSCRKRSFFVTKQGYMGLAPPGAKAGDLICILLGCELPLIIRKQGQQYSLVGQCYVLGMMHGEIMEDVKSGKYCVETLELI